jgi:hypothetical protein
LKGDKERILQPGANRLTHVPKLENLGMVKSWQWAPTARTVGSEAGDIKQASDPKFPAAATTKIPLLTEALIAAFIASDLGDVKDKFMMDAV